MVGWPGFTIEAPAGTIIELLVHEAHAPGGPPLLNTHFDSWTRFICREGRNEFETFDFESLRWLQLHIHNAKGPVTISDVRVRRRVFPWPNQPRLRTSEPALQRLFDAVPQHAQQLRAGNAWWTAWPASASNTAATAGIRCTRCTWPSASGACRPATWRPGARGLTKDGFFLDCWPAYDRLARLVERQFDLSGWGPILDHGVGFIFDCWSHYLYTGDLEALREPYPRLLRFARYLQRLVGRRRLAAGREPRHPLGLD